MCDWYHFARIYRFATSIAVLTRHAGVVDLHIDGVSTTAHQIRIANVDRAVISSVTVDSGRQIRQLDTVSGRRTIATRRVPRRDAVERLDDSDQLRTAVWPRRTPQSKCRHAWNTEALTGVVHDRWRVCCVIPCSSQQHKHAPAGFNRPRIYTCVYSVCIAASEIA